jgi:hypothetical protein
MLDIPEQKSRDGFDFAMDFMSDFVKRQRQSEREREPGKIEHDHSGKGCKKRGCGAVNIVGNLCHKRRRPFIKNETTLSSIYTGSAFLCFAAECAP